METYNIYIDNRLYKAKKLYTIFQFCAKQGINIPCFCYHERLNIAGNCRICLVESNSNLVASCTTQISNNINIQLNTKRVKRVRENIMEFLLANHPIDCAICDQGGECDLQDITSIFGYNRGRFYELNKKTVINLNTLGPFIKTIMTRCIQCTRCVRFVNEIINNNELGVTSRGQNMEINQYIQIYSNSELIGNIIDLCPVGALTSMPSAYNGRVWEYKYLKSIDISDSIASNVRIAIADNKIKRITPYIDEYYDEWITNKARFVYDSYNIQRLYNPRFKLGYKFITISWKNALIIFLRLLYNKRKNIINAFLGNYSSIELVISVKKFFNKIGSSNIKYNEDLNFMSSDFRFLYLLNNSISDIENYLTLVLIGCNPRLEFPLLNSKIRKNYLKNNFFKVLIIGNIVGDSALTYPVENLGSSIQILYKFLKGNLLASKYLLHRTKIPTDLYYLNVSNLISVKFYVGSSFLIRTDLDFIVKSLIFFVTIHNLQMSCINLLTRVLGRISYLEVGGYKPKYKNQYILKKNKIKFNFFLDIDDCNKIFKKEKNVNIYLGPFYISEVSKNFNMLLSSKLYTETTSTYINLEGKLRMTKKIITPFKNIEKDSEIIEALNTLNKYINKNNFSIIINWIDIYNQFNNIFNEINVLKILLLYSHNKKNEYFLENHFDLYKKSLKYQINNSILQNSNSNQIIYNFYNSDIFSKKSRIMQKASEKIDLELVYLKE